MLEAWNALSSTRWKLSATDLAPPAFVKLMAWLAEITEHTGLTTKIILSVFGNPQSLRVLCD